MLLFYQMGGRSGLLSFPRAFQQSMPSLLSLYITPICAPAATVQQFVSAYSLSFEQCYAHRFSKLMLEGECYFLTVICLRMIIHSPPQHYSYKLYTNEDPFSWLPG